MGIWERLRGREARAAWAAGTNGPFQRFDCSVFCFDPDDRLLWSSSVESNPEAPPALCLSRSYDPRQVIVSFYPSDLADVARCGGQEGVLEMGGHRLPIRPMANHRALTFRIGSGFREAMAGQSELAIAAADRRWTADVGSVEMLVGALDERFMRAGEARGIDHCVMAMMVGWADMHDVTFHPALPNLPVAYSWSDGPVTGLAVWLGEQEPMSIEEHGGFRRGRLRLERAEGVDAHEGVPVRWDRRHGAGEVEGLDLRIRAGALRAAREGFQYSLYARAGHEDGLPDAEERLFRAALAGVSYQVRATRAREGAMRESA